MRASAHMKKKPSDVNRRVFFYSKKKLLRNFLIYQVWGLAPIPPTIRLNTQTLCTFGKKTYIRSTQRQPAERYGRVAKKISCQGELTEFRHPWQLYSFPTVLIRSSGFLLRLVCLVYLYTSPYPCHKGSKTKHRQKYYQFHNTVILIS